MESNLSFLLTFRLHPPIDVDLTGFAAFPPQLEVYESGQMDIVGCLAEVRGLMLHHPRAATTNPSGSARAPQLDIEARAPHCSLII